MEEVFKKWELILQKDKGNITYSEKILKEMLSDFRQVIKPKKIIKQNEWGIIKETSGGNPCSLCKYEKHSKGCPCECCFAILQPEEYFI